MKNLLNKKNKMNGLHLLNNTPDNFVKLVFLDPQYRGVLDKLSYGNEGSRQKKRAQLPQMEDDVIRKFVENIERVLVPSGHFMLWVDKFHLVEGVDK